MKHVLWARVKRCDTVFTVKNKQKTPKQPPKPPPRKPDTFGMILKDR